MRNLGLMANTIMSHILHFYHLAALDFVDARSLIPKGPFCPNYANSYYARGIDPIGAGGSVYTINDLGATLPQGVPYLGDLTPYIAGQYVRALKFRRHAHQIAHLFLGKVPHSSCYTTGWMTTEVPGDILTTSPIRAKVRELLYKGADGTGTLANPHPESILGFIGKPGDFLSWALGGFLPTELPVWAQLGVPGAGAAWQPYTGTYLFDVVAAAHLFPEYFWIGTGYGRLLAYGAYEGAATDIGGAVPGFPGAHADDRLIMRGRTHIRTNPAPGSHPPVPGADIAFQVMDHLKIKEQVDYSYYKEPGGPGTARHPWQGKTKADPTINPSGYTYAKTPRYKNNESVPAWEQTDHPNGTLLPYEVGPLARMYANAQGLSGIPPSTAEVNAVLAGDRMAYYPGVLKDLGYGAIPIVPGYGDPAASVDGLFAGGVLFGTAPLMAGFPSNYIGDATLDRHAARAIETLYLAKNLIRQFNALVPGGPSNATAYFNWGGSTQKKMPKAAQGVGLTEAPRGALAHWIKIGGSTDYKGKVANYQIITPTAWNVSPLDSNLNHGPIERCIQDTPLLNQNEPVEILRVVHSFDCCLACTVHVVTVKDGKKVKTAEAPAGISLFEDTACTVKKK